MRYLLGFWAFVMTICCVQEAYSARHGPAILFGVLAGLCAIAFVSAAFYDAYQITERDPYEK